MQKNTLFSISAEQLRINEMLEESGGELTPEIEEALIINESNFLVKAGGYIETIKRYEALADMAAQRIADFNAYKKTCTNIAKRLKERLAYGMEVMGKDKVELDLHKISFRTSTAVNITDEARIPNNYIKVETKIDKESLKRDLKAGLVIEGAELITNRNIQVR